MSCFMSGWWLLRCLFYSWLNCTSALCTLLHFTKKWKGWQILKVQQTRRGTNIISIFKNHLHLVRTPTKILKSYAIEVPVRPWCTLLSKTRAMGCHRHTTLLVVRGEVRTKQRDSKPQQLCVVLPLRTEKEVRARSTQLSGCRPSYTWLRKQKIAQHGSLIINFRIKDRLGGCFLKQDQKHLLEYKRYDRELQRRICGLLGRKRKVHAPDGYLFLQWNSSMKKKTGEWRRYLDLMQRTDM